MAGPPAAATTPPLSAMRLALRASAREGRPGRRPRRAAIDPCIIPLAGLGVFLALTAVAAWSKVHSLEQDVHRMQVHKDRHEDKARLCAKVLADGAAGAVSQATHLRRGGNPAAAAAAGGTVHTRAEPPAAGAALAVGASGVSLIRAGTCATSPGCHAVADEGMCGWIGSAAAMKLSAGYGHLIVGESQRESAPRGCVLRGVDRLKWNAYEASTAACGEDWGCLCLGSCAPIALREPVDQEAAAKDRRARQDSSVVTVAQRQREEQQRLVSQQEEQAEWRTTFNTPKTAERLYTGEYPRSVTAVKGGGRDRDGCASVKAVQSAAVLQAAGGSGGLTAVADACRAVCEGSQDCQYFWAQARRDADGGDQCCLKAGQADPKKGMMTDISDGAFYQMLAAAGGAPGAVAGAGATAASDGTEAGVAGVAMAEEGKVREVGGEAAAVKAAEDAAVALKATEDAAATVAAAAVAAAADVAAAPSGPLTALLMVVGHLRHYEGTLPSHRKLVRAVADALGAEPAVCIVTYPHRDHHDKTWWHGGSETHDTSVLVDPAAVATAYAVPQSHVHLLEPSAVQNPERYVDFIQQQAKISFNVHVGTFTSISLGYTACATALTASSVPFDVVVRTRPDSEFDLRKLSVSLKTVRARSAEVVASGCMRERSLPGGDFSEVGFVASKMFFDLFVADFDVYRMYGVLFARPCVAYQKGQPKSNAVTGQDREDRCGLWTEQGKACKVNDPPPCSFTPESFLKTWMNGKGVILVPLGKGGLNMVRAGGRKVAVCT